MLKKKFIPCIYMKRGYAIHHAAIDTFMDSSPQSIAKSYENKSADGIIVFDLSENKEERDDSLLVLAGVCACVDIPVIIGARHLSRLEEIQSFIDAGVDGVILNAEIEAQASLLAEAALTIGAERIFCTIKSPDTYRSNQSNIDRYSSAMVLINATNLQEFDAITKQPLMVSLSTVSLDKLTEMLSFDHVIGLTGPAIIDNIDQLYSLKALMLDSGIKVSAHKANFSWDAFKLNSDGHVTVVVQDYQTNEVLMVAYMNQEAYEMTIATGKMTYYSRSRDELWIKGDTSGHYQYVKSLTADCDKDTILAKVAQVGAACHTGSYSCFFQEII